MPWVPSSSADCPSFVRERCDLEKRSVELARSSCETIATHYVGGRTELYLVLDRAL